MASKNQEAQRKYGCDFEDCSPGEKAQVTKAYNAQSNVAPRSTPVARATARTTSVSVEIGRIGNGPAKKFLLEAGKTVQDLVDKSGFGLDTKKETIQAQSTGFAVRLSDVLVSGKTYVIAPEIKSA